MGEVEALAYLQQIPAPEFTHDKLISLFHTYALIGGMPEIVANYSQSKDMASLATNYD